MRPARANANSDPLPVRRFPLDRPRRLLGCTRADLRGAFTEETWVDDNLMSLRLRNDPVTGVNVERTAPSLGVSSATNRQLHGGTARRFRRTHVSRRRARRTIRGSRVDRLPTAIAVRAGERPNGTQFPVWPQQRPPM